MKMDPVTETPTRVLVVDDERAITDLVAMALKYATRSWTSARP